MIRTILTCQTMAATPEELQKAHEKALAKLGKAGIQADVHHVDTPIQAYINHGRWLLDCPCGSGVLTHPVWQIGRCFGCGAFFTRVTFPDNREQIEPVLVQRPNPEHRNWRDESVDDLRAENVAHGVTR